MGLEEIKKRDRWSCRECGNKFLDLVVYNFITCSVMSTDANEDDCITICSICLEHIKPDAAERFKRLLIKNKIILFGDIHNKLNVMDRVLDQEKPFNFFITTGDITKEDKEIIKKWYTCGYQIMGDDDKVPYFKELNINSEINGLHVAGLSGFIRSRTFIKDTENNISFREILYLSHQSDVDILVTHQTPKGLINNCGEQVLQELLNYLNPKIYCITNNCYLQSNRGVLKPSDVIVGDYLLGNSYNKVKQVFKSNSNNIIRVKCVGILPLEITKEHEVLAVKRKKCQYRKSTCRPSCNQNIKRCKQIRQELQDEFDNPKFYPISALKLGDYLAIPIDNIVYDEDFFDCLQLDNTVFNNGLVYPKTSGGHGHPKGIPRFQYLDYDLMFLFGLYLAEGHISNNQFGFSFNKKEYSLINYVQNTIQRKFNLDTKLYSSSKNCVTVIGTSKLFCQFLYFFCGKSASRKNLNIILQHLPINKQKHILKGYLLGDGSKRGNIVDRKRYDVTSATVSQQLNTDIFNLLCRCGYNANMRKSGNNGKIEILGKLCNRKTVYHIEANDINLLNFVFDTDFKCVKPVKHKIRTSNYVFTPIRKIDNVNTGLPVYNFEIDAEPYYRVNSLLVHNCCGHLHRYKTKFHLSTFCMSLPMIHKGYVVAYFLGKELRSLEVVFKKGKKVIRV